ncbi:MULTISPECIES: hypothetical protein [unclassified Oceanobacillus]|uniref:hypothetical protein n=1 Tax=unclassified Oceanobacillus TaxID=2630292 RepID=UPI001BEAB24B|nr:MULTISPECIES: hypothetical protein [unclassified Oceanobacillus]MBT2601434.1 hypothetical protein [Oceanobacillus sp. ISL-74]MBT2653289.1 hypothetical protein [Oceanobacillus sp. ISL-73]
MPNVEGLENVTDNQVSIPEILLDHERRITDLQAQQNKMFEKLDDIKANMKEQNEEQKELLNRLIDHHLDTKKMNLSSFWKWFISITGAGGLITIAITAIVNFI